MWPCEPDTGELSPAYDPTDGLFAGHAGEAWGMMCGFTHGGLEQLNRRVGENGDIGCHFDPEDVQRLLASSTSVLVRTAIQFMGAMNRQDTWEAVSAKYVALYPTRVRAVRNPAKALAETLCGFHLLRVDGRHCAEDIDPSAWLDERKCLSATGIFGVPSFERRSYGIWGELWRSILAVHSAPGRPHEARAFSSLSTLYSTLRIEGTPSARTFATLRVLHSHILCEIRHTPRRPP